ncbi:unnamed protein product [Protopolystoma xenopodis]|uniref:Uncharacterized protein n=1 Tax=Protopolystoma xenopodis TaxID=117903 RepID=A0A3S5BMK3_9PLAT|nr:unnamed protein product [Protopolystoma xenopodis]
MLGLAVLAMSAIVKASNGLALKGTCVRRRSDNEKAVLERMPGDRNHRERKQVDESEDLMLEEVHPLAIVFEAVGDKSWPRANSDAGSSTASE